MAIPFLSDISGQGATFAGNLTIQKDDPTILTHDPMVTIKIILR